MCIMGTKKAGCGFGLSTPLETLESSEQQVGSAAREIRRLTVICPSCVSAMSVDTSISAGAE